MCINKLFYQYVVKVRNSSHWYLVTDLISYGNKTTELCCMIDNLVKSFEYFKF